MEKQAEFTAVLLNASYFIGYKLSMWWKDGEHEHIPRGALGLLASIVMLAGYFGFLVSIPVLIVGLGPIGGLLRLLPIFIILGLISPILGKIYIPLVILGGAICVAAGYYNAVIFLKANI